MAVETAIVVTHASTWWRLLLLPLLYSAIIGLMQAWKGVCIRNAIRGTRNMGAGDELVTDELERSALRGRGLVTIVQAILGAAIITAILMFMPTL